MGAVAQLFAEAFAAFLLIGNHLVAFHMVQDFGLHLHADGIADDGLNAKTGNFIERQDLAECKVLVDTVVPDRLCMPGDPGTVSNVYKCRPSSLL